MEQNHPQTRVDPYQNNDHSNPMPMPTTPNLQQASQDGIDIQKAMSILSSRPQNDHTHIDNNLKEMGQTINLVQSEESQTTSQSNSTTPTTTTTTSKKSTEDHLANQMNTAMNLSNDTNNSSTNDTNESEKKNSSEELLKLQLSKQSPSESLQTLFQLQKERVETYHKFNLGLDQVLSSGNLSNYTHFTAEITATFSVISKSIRLVEQSFQFNKTNDDEKICKDISKWIRELQTKEREKLNLTAALHLEKIREKNEQLNLEMNNDVNGDSDGRIAHLLRQGVVSLEKKIGDCIEEINEVMEELRYCAADIS